LVWLTFDSQAGREQVGRRPALMLSPAPYNRRASLVLVCLTTSQVKHYPFKIALTDGLAISAVILADHVKTADGVARHAEFAASAI
jgi:mRNA interferase MazF